MVIVGAGIVGVTAAYLLRDAGLSVALLEARRIGRQVTGRSTAKITTQHSLIYRHLIEVSGLETAQHYADAIALALTRYGVGLSGLISTVILKRKMPTSIAAIRHVLRTSRLRRKLRVLLGSIQSCSKLRRSLSQPPARCDLETKHNLIRLNI